mmetsp:Transcript_7879/g.11330  ORF Transcript_7879/g.11330 Transcript_7879/m.11330 type:complete len:331 (+) Transcript_7879:59-1051(+)
MKWKSTFCLADLILLLCSFLVGRAVALSVENHMSVDDFRSKITAHYPTRLRQPTVVEEALLPREYREWWKHIQTRSKREVVRVERQATGGIYEQTLLHALEVALFQSSSRDPIFITSTSSSCSTDQLPVYDFHESFFNSSGCIGDWFPLFSPYTHICDQLVIIGESALSRLESNPFTILNTCIAGGPSIWKFLPFHSEEELVGQQVPFDKFEKQTQTWDGYPFSTGWQSTTNLFDERGVENLKTTTITTRPGDILIIPPGWWYQSSGVGQPNVSIRSQRCGKDDMQHLIEHIMSAKGIDKTIVIPDKKSIDMKEASCLIRELFEVVEATR